MRLPVLPGEDHPIDRAEGKRMVDRAIDGGITYFDTAYGYHNEESEVFVGEALKGLRNRVTLTTKLPCWKVEKREDMDALLDTQLQRLQTDHVDFYLLHALNAKSFDKMVSLGVFEFLDRAQAQGKIRYPGFSFHDDSETFRRIVDAYDWKLAQVQMNILDEHKQATMDGVRYAREEGDRYCGDGTAARRRAGQDPAARGSRYLRQCARTAQQRGVGLPLFAG